MAAEISNISATTVIRGNVRGEGKLQVDGQVHGSIEVTGDVELGSKSIVQGDISGARLTIAGQVDGNLTGTEAVLVAATARVKGDLTAPRVGIEEGALVRGAVQTDGAPAAPRTSARSAVAIPARVTRIAEARSSVETKAKPPVPAKNAPPAESRSTNSEPKKLVKRAPPPPVIKAPKRGAKARRRVAR